MNATLEIMDHNARMLPSDTLRSTTTKDLSQLRDQAREQVIRQWGDLLKLQIGVLRNQQAEAASMPETEAGIQVSFATQRWSFVQLSRAWVPWRAGLKARKCKAEGMIPSNDLEATAEAASRKEPAESRRCHFVYHVLYTASHSKRSLHHRNLIIVPVLMVRVSPPWAQYIDF